MNILIQISKMLVLSAFVTPFVMILKQCYNYSIGILLLIAFLVSTSAKAQSTLDVTVHEVDFDEGIWDIGFQTEPGIYYAIQTSDQLGGGIWGTARILQSAMTQAVRERVPFIDPKANREFLRVNSSESALAAIGLNGVRFHDIGMEPRESLNGAVNNQPALVEQDEYEVGKWLFTSNVDGIALFGSRGVVEETALTAALAYRDLQGLTPGKNYWVGVAYLWGGNSGPGTFRCGFQGRTGLNVFGDSLMDIFDDSEGRAFVNLGVHPVHGLQQRIGELGHMTADENGSIRVFLASTHDGRTSAIDGLISAESNHWRPNHDIVYASADLTHSWFCHETTAQMPDGAVMVSGVDSQGWRVLERFISSTLTRNKITFKGRGESPLIDDHDPPALLQLPDGRWLVAYTRHGKEAFVRIWRSTNSNPTSVNDFEELGNAATPSGISYAGLFYLAQERKIHLYSRGLLNGRLVFGRMTSDDFGKTWSEFRVIMINGYSVTSPFPGDRYYPRWVEDGVSKIHWCCNFGSPGYGGPDGMFHFYYENGAWWQSDGTLIALDEDLPFDGTSGNPRPTEVFDGIPNGSPIVEGLDSGIPGAGYWIQDAALDHQGNPVFVWAAVDLTTPTYFQNRPESNASSREESDNWRAGDRHYYYYSRWNGGAWITHFLAQGGTGINNYGLGRLLNSPSYSGGAAISDRDPNIVYLSSNSANIGDANSTEVKISQQLNHTIFRASTEDDGESWSYKQLVDRDELRCRPRYDVGSGALFYQSGIYDNFVHYACKEAFAGIDP